MVNVYIVNNYGQEYTNMFEKNYWKVVDEIREADLVQFVGGEDVSPSFYGQHAHPKTLSNPSRDKKERMLFLLALKHKIPMAGICRGGQFLNVMCGGSMWQNVSGHGGSHSAVFTDLKMKKKIEVTSTHHQMIFPTNKIEGYTLLMVARQKGIKEKCSSLKHKFKIISVSNLKTDIEAIYYKKENVLCFQPHPEFAGEKNLADLYFRFVDKFCFRKRG